VPAAVIGRRGGRAWITTINGADEPNPSPLGAEFSVDFARDAASEERHLALVRDAVERIQAGAARKIVLARTIEGSLPANADLRRVVHSLATEYPSALTFAVDGLLGASPETLVRVEGNRLSARVLAGTAARGQDPSGDADAQSKLAASEKEQEEHYYARQSVLDALAPHSTDLAASETFVLELPNLLHLASDVEGTIADGASSLDLVAALHPTAAVAGTPTDVAIRLIGELEPFDRRRYLGPVGWIGADGDGEWAVALRCAEISGDRVIAFAGGGIVADSVAEDELAETALKFRPIVEAFR
jgi:menaquinone-specific isochorismate synthase